MDESGQLPAGRDTSGRFAAGNPGRPFGSRNRVSKRVARTILRDFEANQESVLPLLRRWFLPQYVQLISRLLPRQTEEGGAELESLTEVELAGLLAATRVALDRIEAGEGSVSELEAALLGERHNLGAVVIGD
ncbi:MAG TPA: hypothetical protein VME40_16715 [Caulobacteraceae bacterium]|nr:hypothetical protein [Caulobacteraceae bacterium]